VGRGILKHGLILLDLLAVVASFLVAYFFRYTSELFSPGSEVQPFGFYEYAIILAIGIWMLLFVILRLDQFQGGRELPLALSQLATAWLLFMAMLLAGSYLAKIFYSRLLLLILAFFLLVFLILSRFVYRLWLGWLQRYGIGIRRVVIVGRSELALELAVRIRQHPELRYEVIGFLFPVSNREVVDGRDTEMGNSEEVARSLANRGIDEMVFAIPVRRESEVLEFIAHCQKYGIAIKLVPEYYELHTRQITSFNVDGIPLLELRETSFDPSFQVVKLLFDFLLVPFLLVLSFPITALISIMLYAARGSVIWREVRIGLNGKPFTMFRFDCLMDPRARQNEKRRWVLRFCRFLNRYSLSELPQLWNVLRGEMSIVGPRPETPERVRHYSAWHRRRLGLKPGITGLAQVKGLREADSSDSKTKYDLEYAANFTPFLDLTLILATIGTLMGRKSGRPAASPVSFNDAARVKFP
jgi:exopolysaccharide biosynthesis polyprenyl glycosylphosphotransferase